MVKATKVPHTITQSSALTERLLQKPFKVIENIFQNNTNSEFTEKIQELEKKFEYSSNSDNYWSEPEQSILYGTPLYEAATSSQRMALNHLYWAIQYSKVPADEATTMIFNQVTGSVFSTLGGFGTLCQELELETSQERYHIHAFQRISRLTKKALLCNKLKQSYFQKSNLSGNQLYSLSRVNFFKDNFEISQFFERSSYSTLRFINKFMLESQGKQPSKYLQELEKKNEFLQVPTDGVFSRFPFRRQTAQLLTFNFGTSPFLASHYYALRLIANMMLKNWEYNYAQYYRKLERNAEFIPVPTSVSYFHFLDESFHTTTSKTIAQNLYRSFSKPTVYERFIANITLYLMQLNLKGLSGAIPYRFIEDDPSFIGYFYQLLQTPLFDLSASEALYWLEKCFCQEHEGFHLTFNHHQRLLSNLRQTFVDVEYFWPVNREMRLMASGGNIDKSVQNNINTFKIFSQSLAYL